MRKLVRLRLAEMVRHNSRRARLQSALERLKAINVSDFSHETLTEWQKNISRLESLIQASDEPVKVKEY